MTTAVISDVQDVQPQQDFQRSVEALLTRGEGKETLAGP
jgi:hypothetical protein